MAVLSTNMGQYISLQTAKGTLNAGAQRAILHPTKATVSKETQSVQGERALAQGLWKGPSAMTGFKYNWGMSGNVTMRRMPHHAWGMVGPLVTTGDVGDPQLHKYSLARYANDIKWYTITNIFGQESAGGTGFATEVLHDAKLQNWSMQYSNVDFLKFNLEGLAIQEGLPAGTESYIMETIDVQPLIKSSTHVFTWPTAWAAFADDLCLQTMDINYKSTLEEAPGCADGDGELSDIQHGDAVIETKFKFLYDEAGKELYRKLSWVDVAPAAGARAANSVFTFGNVDYTLKSNELMGAGDLAVPYELGGHLVLQIVGCKKTTEGKWMLVEIDAKTYEVNPTSWFSVLNPLTNAQQKGTAEE